LPMFEHNICTESAISFLARAKESKGNLEDLPQNVLVIGGGDVAMDVVTTLKKLNVPYVTDVVYEQFDEFKASKKELAGAQEAGVTIVDRSEEHTSELQSRFDLVCRLLLEKKNSRTAQFVTH